MAIAELHERGRVLFEYLWESLAAIPGVSCYGPSPGSARTPTLSFTLANRDARVVAGSLAERGVFVSHGDFYAPSVARVLGHAEDGLVRAGCAAYTTLEEVERLAGRIPFPPLPPERKEAPKGLSKRHVSY